MSVGFIALGPVRLGQTAADAIPLPVTSTISDSLLGTDAHGSRDRDCAVLDRTARRAGLER